MSRHSSCSPARAFIQAVAAGITIQRRMLLWALLIVSVFSSCLPIFIHLAEFLHCALCHVMFLHLKDQKTLHDPGSDGDVLFIPCHLVSIFLSSPITVTLACCSVLGCLVTFISLELHSTLKYLKKEIYLRQPDRKVPEIDGIWNLLRFPICSSLKLIKHSLLAGVTPFFIIRILAAKDISIYF